ncbi:MAG: hypothetical protein FJZ59_04310 [Chlamydiae bacterium]|nr:hypothetical protein [Chlamydiota bacterium]
MLPVSAPESPNLIMRPTLVPLNFGYELPLEEVMLLKEGLFIEETASLDVVTEIALERLRGLGFSSILFSPQQIRVWFLAYEFAFVKMTSISVAEKSDGCKKSSMVFISKYIHLLATKYFSSMQERFSDKQGALDGLFEFRRKRLGFDAWVLEESTSTDVYDLINEILEDEEAFKAAKERREKKPLKFIFG